MRLVVLLLTTALLAGCTAGGGSDGPATMGAHDAHGPAERSASAWASDSLLVGASASELDDAARAELAAELDEAREALRDPEAREAVGDEAIEAFEDLLAIAQKVADTPDPAIGDGKATMWSFLYSSDEQADLYSVTVFRGSVIDARALSDGFGDEFEFDFGFLDLPVGEWTVDSADAAAAAAVGDVTFASLIEEPNVIVTYALGLDDGTERPVWQVGVEADDVEDGPDEAYVAVDALDGSLLSADVEPIVDVLLQEMGRDGGTFVAQVGGGAEMIFDVLDGRHQELAVRALVSPAPAQPIEATLTAPDGTQTALTLQLGAMPGNAQDSVVLAVVPNGTYSVDFEVPVALLNSWSVSWCTDGTPDDDYDGFDEPACNLLAQNGGGGQAVERGETLSRAVRWPAPWPA